VTEKSWKLTYHPALGMSVDMTLRCLEFATMGFSAVKWGSDELVISTQRFKNSPKH